MVHRVPSITAVLQAGLRFCRATSSHHTLQFIQDALKYRKYLQVACASLVSIKSFFISTCTAGLLTGWKGHECATWSCLGRTSASGQLCDLSSSSHSAWNGLDRTNSAVADHQYANRESQDNCVPVFEGIASGCP